MRLRLNNVDVVIVVQGGDRWKMPGAVVDVAVVDAADVGSRHGICLAGDLLAVRCRKATGSLLSYCTTD